MPTVYEMPAIIATETRVIQGTVRTVHVYARGSAPLPKFAYQSVLRQSPKTRPQPRPRLRPFESDFAGSDFDDPKD